MKKKILVLILGIFMILGVGLTACHSHIYSEEWAADSQYHWHVGECGHDVTQDREKHNFKSNKCTVCGYIVAATHKHNPIPYSYKAPDCTEDGNIAYYVCSTCGAYFADEACQNEITKADTIIQANGHSVTNEFLNNNVYHWQIATCDHEDEVIANKGLHVLDENNKCKVCDFTANQTDMENSLLFTKNPDGVSYAVTGLDINASKQVIVPATYDGLPVTTIAGLEDPNSQTSPFAQRGLVSITIGANVTTIGKYAFFDCTTLQEVIFADKVETVEQAAFAGCSNLTTVTLNSGLKTLADYAFNYCEKLESIEIFNVESIGMSAFYGCESLEKVTIGEGLTKLGDGAFFGCKKLDSIVIPEGVETIGFAAFYGCSSLKSIVYPKSAKEIGVLQLYGCTSLESLTIPYIGLNINENYFMGYLFAEEFTETTDAESSNTYVPASLKIVTITNANSLSEKAFLNCSSINKIYLPETLVSIGANAFSGCSISYNELDGALYLGSVDNKRMVLIEAVNKNIASFEISTDTTIIADEAFKDCVFLKDINIPTNIKSIGTDAFTGCDRIQYNSIDGMLYLGSGNNKYYMLVRPENSRITSVSVREGTSIIANGAFEGCKNLKSVDLPEGIISIGTKAFYDCVSLQSVNIRDGISYIASDAFGNCTSLYSIAIPDSITTLSGSAFSGCKNLKTIEIPVQVLLNFNADNILSLTITGTGVLVERVMSYNTSIEKLVIKGNISTIETRAFIGCTSLKTIEINDSVTVIETSAFEGCTSLVDFAIGSGLREVGERIFYNCNSFKTIYVSPDNEYFHSSGNCLIETETKILYAGTNISVIPDDGSVTTLAYCSFHGRHSLTSLIIPKSVTIFEEGTFAGCKNLTSIYYGGSTGDWNAISKGGNWDLESAVYTVYCNNGTIVKATDD